MKRLAVLAASILLGGCPGPQEAGDPAASLKALQEFSFARPAAEGVIDESSGTISVGVPAGTDCSALVANFRTSGESVTVGDVVQESGVTPNDFRAPVQYVVHAADGTSSPWLVTVQPGSPPSGEKALRRFSLIVPPVEGVIDQGAAAVRADVPHGTDVTSLVASFETTGVRVSVEDTDQESGVTINDFTGPLLYVVHAEDGSTASYLVSVLPAADTRKSLTSFAITTPPCTGFIDEERRVIRIRLPPGTDLSALVAAFTATGPLVTVGGVPQVSGLSVNDFRSPVDYVVTAEDGSTCAWSVHAAGTIDLLINELDIDQPGTDTAEFVELYSRTGVELAGLAVVFVNGGSLPGLEYARVDLGAAGSLGPGTYLVLAGPAVTVAPGATRLAPASWELSNRIQNGPNDAAVLYDTLGRRAVDAVAYNGVLHRALINGDAVERDAMEGDSGAPADSGSTPGSVGRDADGTDTGQNGTDFRFTSPPTPGAPNN